MNREEELKNIRENVDEVYKIVGESIGLKNFNYESFIKLLLTSGDEANKKVRDFYDALDKYEKYVGSEEEMLPPIADCVSRIEQIRKLGKKGDIHMKDVHEFMEPSIIDALIDRIKKSNLGVKISYDKKEKKIVVDKKINELKLPVSDLELKEDHIKFKNITMNIGVKSSLVEKENENVGGTLTPSENGNVESETNSSKKSEGNTSAISDERKAQKKFQFSVITRLLTGGAIAAGVFGIMLSWSGFGLFLLSTVPFLAGGAVASVPIHLGIRKLDRWINDLKPYKEKEGFFKRHRAKSAKRKKSKPKKRKAGKSKLIPNEIQSAIEEFYDYGDDQSISENDIEQALENELSAETSATPEIGNETETVTEEQSAKNLTPSDNDDNEDKIDNQPENTVEEQSAEDSIPSEVNNKNEAKENNIKFYYEYLQMSPDELLKRKDLLQESLTRIDNRLSDLNNSIEEINRRIATYVGNVPEQDRLNLYDKAEGFKVLIDRKNYYMDELDKWKSNKKRTEENIKLVNENLDKIKKMFQEIDEMQKEVDERRKKAIEKINGLGSSIPPTSGRKR